MLSAVLSGYDGARLERALTQGAQPVADSASSSALVIGRGPSLFLLSGVPAAGRAAQQVEGALSLPGGRPAAGGAAQRVKAARRAEVARGAGDGVGQAELDRVKTQWIAASVYQRDSMISQAQELGSNW